MQTADGYLPWELLRKKFPSIPAVLSPALGADLPLEEEKQPRNDLNVPLNHLMLPRGPLT